MLMTLVRGNSVYIPTRLGMSNLLVVFLLVAGTAHAGIVSPATPFTFGTSNADPFSFDVPVAGASNSYLAVAIYKDDDVQDIADVTFNGASGTWAQNGRAAYAYFGGVTDGNVTVEISTLPTGVDPVTGDDVFDSAPYAVVAYQVDDVLGVNAALAEYDPNNPSLIPTDTQITTTENAAILSVAFNDRSGQNGSSTGDQSVVFSDTVQFVSTAVGVLGPDFGVPAGTYDLSWSWGSGNERRVGEVAFAFQVNPIPEPTSCLLACFALASLALLRKSL